MSLHVIESVLFVLNKILNCQECPSPDGNGNPFAPLFGGKDCIGQRESASENKI